MNNWEPTKLDISVYDDGNDPFLSVIWTFGPRAPKSLPKTPSPALLPHTGPGGNPFTTPPKPGGSPVSNPSPPGSNPFRDPDSPASDPADISSDPE